MTLDWTKSREEYRWIAALAAVTIVAYAIASVVGSAARVSAQRVTFAYVQVIWLLAPAALGLAAIPLAFRLFVGRRNGFAGELAAFARDRFGSPALAAGSLAPILFIPVLMGSFGTLKMVLPLWRDFTWDDSLAAADKILFLGYQPWQFTHALFGPFLTDLIDLSYSLWVALMFSAVLFYALAAPRYERARFFLSFGASWVLIGVAGAYLFASAGPCYAERIGAVSAAEFAPLMARLREIHEAGFRLAAFEWQEKLWLWHSTRTYGFAHGISAMPSMHNAIALLYAFSAARGPKLLRAAAWTFFALIFVGSVHLGWHYAVDGIVAGLMMWAIWAGAGAFLDRVGYARALARGDDEDGESDLPDFAGKPVAI